MYKLDSWRFGKTFS